jgi:hypothetical protein
MILVSDRPRALASVGRIKLVAEMGSFERQCQRLELGKCSTVAAVFYSTVARVAAVSVLPVSRITPWRTSSETLALVPTSI